MGAKMMRVAAEKVERFLPRVRLVQQSSTLAARLFDDETLDLIFIDAGHNECAVRQDLEAWWPKLKRGGLVAGDDYADAAAALEMYGQNWSTCEESVRRGAVRGAVDRFFAQLGLQVSVFWIVGASLSAQWLIFKP